MFTPDPRPFPDRSAVMVWGQPWITLHLVDSTRIRTAREIESERCAGTTAPQTMHRTFRAISTTWRVGMAVSQPTRNNRGIMPRPHMITMSLLVALLASDTVLAAADPPPTVPTSARSPSAVTPSSDAALSALLRTAIVTADLAASKRFYVDGLGFRVRFEGDITRPAVIRQLGLAAGQTAWFVVLQGAASLHGQPVVG